jgi:hypothetical protein
VVPSHGHPTYEGKLQMSMIWGTVRRGSITLAGTCLVLDLTGFSATAVAGRNGAVAPAARSSVSQHSLTEPSETVRTCANGRLSEADGSTCDPIDPVNE